MRAAEKHISRRDPVLRHYIKLHGECRLQMHTRHFQTLVNSIVSQQLSTKAADTIFQRFVGLYAPAKFPKPAEIVATSDEALRSVGLSGQKLSYIKDLAAKVDDGTIHLKRISQMSDDEIIAELTQVKGIGVWTVQMFLIFSLGRLNVLPVGDLGIRMAIQRLYSLDELPKAAQIEAIAEQNKWHPYCSVASWYLWRSLENKAM
ncbi:MAG: DNA-3-methyladenine glycosylase 2 family protein [Acidobacteria bacterium]|nr:DNA-3-methyladenine glycosylase 2 family protein [Acidobacteriota bacterium]